MKEAKLIEKLKILRNDPAYNALDLYVIDDILDQEPGYVEGYIKDVLNHGCISGTCSNLIYYKDTYKFFDDYYSEIMDIVNELNSQGVDVNLEKSGDIKNTGAWLAYEETVRKIADELGIEY